MMDGRVSCHFAEVGKMIVRRALIFRPVRGMTDHII